MDSNDWQSAIKMNLLILRAVGLWPRGGYKLNFYTLYGIVIVVVFICGSVTFQNLYFFMVKPDLATLSEPMFIALTKNLASFKIVYIMLNMKRIQTLMRSVKRDLHSIETENQKRTIEPVFWIWKMLYVSLWFMSVVCITWWSIVPFLEGDYRLVYAAWYPYDFKKSPLYQITYLHQVFGVFMTASSDLSVDCLMAAFMMFTAVQCDILSDDLRRLECEGFSKNLVKCIQHHRLILSFAERSNRILNFLALGQFFTSSITIGFAMFRLSMVAPLSNESYSPLSFVIAIGLQLFIYCWFGNEVEVKNIAIGLQLFICCWFGNEVEAKSSQIPYAAFESDWTGIPLEAKRNLIIFIIRTQRPIKMSAINLFSLSLATFTTILRTSWSYFAVLRTVNAPK